MVRQSKKRTEGTGLPGLRQVMAVSTALALSMLVTPLFLPLDGPVIDADGLTVQTEGMLPIDRPVQSGRAKDRGRAVRLQTGDGSVAELTMDDYLWGVVAAEMPASFEPAALEAQACAARTYTVMLQSAPKHTGADVCGNSTCCQAYVERDAALARWGLNAGSYEEKIRNAVANTDGLGVLYGGEPIQALFFSSAAGRTVDAIEVWGNAVDYLKSVDSPEGEEVPNYRSQVSLPAQDVKALTLAAYPGADLSGDPSGWFGEAHRNENGLVNSITLGGVTLTGRQVRSLFSLRSATFTVEWDGSCFVFSTVGYGHGVGMSQYGANAMAREGKTFREILAWYYTGAQVGALW